MVLVFAGFRISDGCWWHCQRNCLIESRVLINKREGGQYATLALDYRYYPIGFVVAESSFPLYSRPVPLDYTCHCNYLVDYMAGAASER